MITKVGVLALQGDFYEHKIVLEALGVKVVLVRTVKDLNEISGLVIPGGESTVIDKLLFCFDLVNPLQKAITAGLPVFGTCAGLIVLADRLYNQKTKQYT